LVVGSDVVSSVIKTYGTALTRPADPPVVLPDEVLLNLPEATVIVDCALETTDTTAIIARNSVQNFGIVHRTSTSSARAYDGTTVVAVSGMDPGIETFYKIAVSYKTGGDMNIVMDGSAEDSGSFDGTWQGTGSHEIKNGSGGKILHMKSLQIWPYQMSLVERQARTAA
jgi:hypothetical protein